MCTRFKLGGDNVNYYIQRNLNKRKELFALVKAMEAQKQIAIDSLDTALSDEEWDQKIDEIDQKFDTMPIIIKIHSLEHPESRNEWFRKFVQSFGICESKRITRKQADIFYRYSEGNHDHESGRGLSYFVNVNNLFCECRIYPECAYVTIREISKI